MKRLRSKIDRIDNKLIKLLNKRLDVVEQIRIYKKNNNIKTFDPDRETKIIARLVNDSKGKLNTEDIKEI
jgi:chorismate mutase